ncbi:unnamed protein product, partial [Brassica oleracea var. botrytis]
VLKKFSRNIGRLKLSVVTLYAKQLLLNLKHLKNCLFFTATYIKAWQHVEAILSLLNSFRNLHISFPWLRNNGILHFRMELKGPFPKKMLRKVSLKFNIGDFFSSDLSFNVTEGDSAIYAGKDTNVLVHFRDLLDKISIIDLEKRLSVSHAFAHAFITGK